MTGIPDREFGDGAHDFLYLPVANPTTGKTWLNNNLGAHYADVNHVAFNPVQQATAFDDYLAFGSLFQQGRYADGHELTIRSGSTTSAPVHSGTIFGKSSTPSPPNNDFYYDSTNTFWLNPPDNTLWDGVNAVNNPCPEGYRLPERSELEAEYGSWATQNLAGAFGSELKLTRSGNRDPYAASNYRYAGGQYWAAKDIDLSDGILNPTLAYTRDNSVTIHTGFIGFAASVRCIKD